MSLKNESFVSENASKRPDESIFIVTFCNRPFNLFALVCIEMLYTQMLDKALICYKTVKQSDSEYPELCARLLQLERANKLPMNAQEDDEARLQRLFGLACRGGDKTADLANEYFQQMSGVDTAWPVIA